MQCVTLPRITELNPHLLCVLCGGYYIDATSIIECLHAFCKSCIVRYLETHKYCPICDVLVHKTEPLQNIRPDVIRQSIVYKLVPNLYKKEMRNRRNFYVQVNPQQHPACSESKGEITESSNFFSLDDLINLSLEYVNSINEKNFFFVAKGSKRYFRCRAAVTIRSLRRLLAAKYALGVEHKIHMFLDGIQLPDHFRLLDIAYISSWKRVGYIRILYEILTSDRSVTCAEKIDLCEVESLTDECKKEDTEDTNADVPAVDAAAVKCEDSSSILKPETIDVETSTSSRQSPIVTVDLTSVNTPSQPQDEADPCPSAASTLASIPATADEQKPAAAMEAVVIASVDLTQPSEKTDSSPSIKSSEAEESSADSRKESSADCRKESTADSKKESSTGSQKESSADRKKELSVDSKKESGTDGKEEPSTDCKDTQQLKKERSIAETADKAAIETGALAKDSEKPAVPPKVNDVPAKAPAAKEAPKSANSKKERRGDRSESLPPVPGLRMITTALPKTTKATTTTKPSTKTPTATKASTTKASTVASSCGQPVISIPRIQSAPPSKVNASNLAASKVSYPATSKSAPLIPAAGSQVTTELISLFAKSPVVRQPQPKKPPPAGLSILRIDPKTLSPIEASSPAQTAVVPVSSGSRKMLPCRPITTSAYDCVYSCAGATALHPYGKFSSPPPLYPHLLPSSLHPMNELVRRMFPFSPFASMDPAMKPLDPAHCLVPYPQSLTSAVNHFLPAAKPQATPPKAKGEKGRRKLVGPQAALNSGEKAPLKGEKAQFKGGAADRGYKRALTNGQVKSAVKRKNSELSDFSINNLIPQDVAKRPAPPRHACTADGVNEVCDQVAPAASPRIEFRRTS